MSKVKSYQLVEPIIKSIGSKKSLARALSSTKKLLEYDNLIEILESLEKSIPAIKESVYGTLFPNTLEELAAKEIYFFKPESIEKEINWVLLSIRKHSDKLIKFISYKHQIEHVFLLGKFDLAESKLEEMKLELGVSIWYYSIKFLIYEYLGRPTDAIALASRINESKQDSENGFAPLLTGYLSIRAAKSLSPYKYDEDLLSRFKRNRTDFQVDFYNYCLFRLNFYSHYNIDDLCIPLIMECENSLIDRYLIICMVLKASFIKDPNDSIITSRALYLYNKTSDETLLPILLYRFPQFKRNEYFDKDYLSIIDSYYKGEYKTVVENSRDYVSHNTSHFDILVFYCRSLLFLGNGYHTISHNGDSPINQICLKMYEVLSGKESSNSLYELYKINKNLYDFEIAHGLDIFIKSEKSISVPIELRCLSLTVFDPLYSLLYSTEKDSLEYLSWGKSETMTQSVSIDQYERRINKEITPNGVVAIYIQEIDNAKVLYEAGEYHECCSKWINIINNFPTQNPIVQVGIKYAFDCLVNQNALLEAIKLYVAKYIDNPNSVAKVNVINFMQILKEKRYKGIKRCIELPIFVGLNAGEDTDKSFILQSFCEYYNKFLPSEIIEDLEDFSSILVETFFYVLISEDTLRHYIYINSTQERLEESQKILNYLVNLNTDKSERYKRLLNEVFDELVIYQGTQKINESKIYANDQAIIKYELKDLEGLYERFKTYFSMLEAGTPLIALDFSHNSIIEGKLLEPVIKVDLKYSDNSIYEVAYSLYDTIREKFLFSKFGLGTYLSTRIRHGVIDGELRAELVSKNIVLNMENDKYVPSIHWSITYGLDNKSHNELSRFLEIFSRSVDDIIKDFKENILQIKLRGVRENGLFDYDISVEELSITAIRLGSISNNTDEFCLRIIENLWEVTERNLSNIKNYIANDLTDKFDNAFNQLKKSLIEKRSENYYEDIIRDITDAQTLIINNKLKIVEGWFNIQESKFNDFNLKELFDIVWKSTEKFFPKRPCSCDIEMEGANITIQSTYGIHFSDLFRIFLTNMFKYSKKDEFGKIRLKVKTFVKEDILQCIFTNEIHENEGLLNEKFQQLLDADNQKLQLEGGSGLSKAQKIVKFDLGDPTNHINILASGGACNAFININLTNLIAYEENTNH